jgi:hypothetical protein
MEPCLPDKVAKLIITHGLKKSTENFSRRLPFCRFIAARIISDCFYSQPAHEKSPPWPQPRRSFSQHRIHIH